MCGSTYTVSQGFQLSWNSLNFTVVLKLSWSAIVLKFYSFGQNVLVWSFVMLSLHFFTSHDYVYVADVECQVLFSLVILYCFMSNIALVTFLGLQYWSASMINIYEHKKCAFSVSWASWNRQKFPEIVLKFSKKLVLKVHFLLLGALVSYIRPCKLSKSVTVCCCISDLPAAAENSQRWCGLTR